MAPDPKPHPQPLVLPPSSSTKQHQSTGVLCRKHWLFVPPTAADRSALAMASNPLPNPRVEMHLLDEHSRTKINDPFRQNRIPSGQCDCRSNRVRLNIRCVLLTAVVQPYQRSEAVIFRQRRNVPLRIRTERAEMGMDRYKETWRDKC